MTLISVIIPVYNVESYLEDCLNSVIGQTYRNLEIILVNDGSTDGSLQICERFRNQDARVMLINQENGGLSDARNAGIATATGEYITFVDSDDLIVTTFIEQMYGAAIENKAEIVECNFSKFSDGEAVFLKNSCEKEIAVQSYNTETALKLLLEDRLRQMACAKIFERKLIGDVLFEKGKLHEDEFWMYKIFGKALNVVKIDDALYLYRQQSSSIMGKSYHLKRLDAIEAFNGQVCYVQKYFPKLIPVAVRRLFYGTLFHYHQLTVNNVDGERRERKKLMDNLIKYNNKEYTDTWNAKDLLWFKLFLINPSLCVMVRQSFGMI